MCVTDKAFLSCKAQKSSSCFYKHHLWEMELNCITNIWRSLECWLNPNKQTGIPDTAADIDPPVEGNHSSWNTFQVLCWKCQKLHQLFSCTITLPFPSVLKQITPDWVRGPIATGVWGNPFSLKMQQLKLWLVDTLKGKRSLKFVCRSFKQVKSTLEAAVEAFFCYFFWHKWML